MKTSFVIASLALALLAGGTICAAEPTPAGRLAEHRALVARHAAGAVVVKVWLQRGDEEEGDGLAVGYLCPNCDKMHYHDLSDYAEKGIPFETVGYVVAPDRVILSDLRMRAKMIASITVSSGGAETPATMLRRYPAEDALEIKTAKPLPGAKPYVFVTGKDRAAKQFFYTTCEKGLTVSGLLPMSGLRIRHYADRNQDLVKLPESSVVLDESGAPLSLNFREELPFDTLAFTPPSTWKGEDPQAFEQRLDALKRELAASIVPVYIHREATEKRGSRGYSSRDDEAKTDLDTLGFALANGELLVPLAFTASQTAEIDKMEAVLADGTRVALDYVGASDRYSLAVLKFPDGKLPAGVRPVKWRKGACSDLYLSTLYSMGVRAFDGKVAFSLTPTTVSEFTSIRGGRYVPDVYLPSSRGRFGFAVTAQGEVVFARVEMRTQSRWSSESERLPADTLAAFVEKRAFNPEYALRKGKDRIRVAWIGVETQALTKELAREKKATGHLQANQTRGVLVSRVHASTPAAQAGLRTGDVLLYVRRANDAKRTELEARESFGGSLLELGELLDKIDDEHLGMLDADRVSPWPDVEEGVNEVFTRIGIGADVVIAYVRDGEKKEVALKLAQAPTHFRSAKRFKSKEMGAVFADLTFEVRGYFKLADDAPGLVVCKVQPGNPAAVAGLRPLEIVTHVDDQPVKTLKEFSGLVRGKKSFTLSVRRIEKTRVVRINLGEKAASSK